MKITAKSIVLMGLFFLGTFARAEVNEQKIQEDTRRILSFLSTYKKNQNSRVDADQRSNSMQAAYDAEDEQYLRIRELIIKEIPNFQQKRLIQTFVAPGDIPSWFSSGVLGGSIGYGVFKEGSSTKSTTMKKTIIIHALTFAVIGLSIDYFDSDQKVVDKSIHLLEPDQIEKISRAISVEASLSLNLTPSQALALRQSIETRLYRAVNEKINNISIPNVVAESMKATGLESSFLAMNEVVTDFSQDELNTTSTIDKVITPTDIQQAVKVIDGEKDFMSDSMRARWNLLRAAIVAS